MEEVLKVVGLKKYYGEVKAVDGISFSIYKGEIFSLLGPNGAGKTTTMEILEGLRRPDAGEIYYFGERVQKIDMRIKERIGVQLQDSRFFDYLTVKENLEFFAGLYSRKNDVTRLLDILGLQDKSKTLVKHLSGGQLKRLAIAVALVNDPEMVFLDEPTTGLDPQARRTLWNIIVRLKDMGKTIFLTTHYMEEAEQLADRVFIIDHGRIIASGTVNELVNSLGMESVVEFDLDETMPVEEYFKDSRKLEDGRYEITTHDPEKTLSIVYELARKHGVKIRNLVIRRPNLEDVFLHLTGRSLRD